MVVTRSVIRCSGTRVSTVVSAVTIFDGVCGRCVAVATVSKQWIRVTTGRVLGVDEVKRVGGRIADGLVDVSCILALAGLLGLWPGGR